MNEEEKKAFEFIKKRTKELKKYAKRENELVYDDIILNLIKKQDKMINDMALNIKELADLDYSIKEIIENFERKFKQ